jgi:hypothetical protein
VFVIQYGNEAVVAKGPTVVIPLPFPLPGYPLHIPDSFDRKWSFEFSPVIPVPVGAGLTITLKPVLGVAYALKWQFKNDVLSTLRSVITPTFGYGASAELKVLAGLSASSTVSWTASNDTWFFPGGIPVKLTVEATLSGKVSCSAGKTITVKAGPYGSKVTGDLGFSFTNPWTGKLPDILKGFQPIYSLKSVPAKSTLTFTKGVPEFNLSAGPSLKVRVLLYGAVGPFATAGVNFGLKVEKNSVSTGKWAATMSAGGEYGLETSSWLERTLKFFGVPVSKKWTYTILSTSLGSGTFPIPTAKFPDLGLQNAPG